MPRGKGSPSKSQKRRKPPPPTPVVEYRYPLRSRVRAVAQIPDPLDEITPVIVDETAWTEA